MLSFKKIIILPFRIIRYFIYEFFSVYSQVFTDRQQLIHFLRIQLYILFATSTFSFFAISLANLKGIFIVYLMGLGIVVGFFAYFFLNFFSDKGVDFLWGFSGEPSVDELAQPYYRKVELALREERYETALLLLEKVLELDSKQLNAWLKIAQIYHHKLQDYSKALKAYRKILNIIGWEEQDNLYYIEAKKGISQIMKMFSPEKD